MPGAGVCVEVISGLGDVPLDPGVVAWMARAYTSV